LNQSKLKVLVVLFFSLNLLNAYADIKKVHQQSYFSNLMLLGINAQQSGALLESIDLLTSARLTAANGFERSLASAALGASFLQAYRFAEAELSLNEAFDGTTGEEKARVANDLGNVAVALKNPEKAIFFYEQARSLGAHKPDIYLLASLNLARVKSIEDRKSLLAELLPPIKAMPSSSMRARLLLNFANQSLSIDKSSLAQSYEAYMTALQDARSLGAHRIMIEAMDGLAQIYENHKRIEDAQILNEQAIKLANESHLSIVQDVLVRLEWRESRLLKSKGYIDDSLAAMQRAAYHLEAIRQDLPIELEDRTTSFATLLRPIYVGLADLILLRQTAGDARQRETAANEAIHFLELSRQAELQDYLGERCTVVSSTNDKSQTFALGTAVLYPLVLEDRIELLLKWGKGASFQTVKTNVSNLNRLSADMADGLKNFDNDDFLSPAQQIYNLLVRPLEPDLEASQINTLIIASEGSLRTIPFSALHDGKQFLIEKFSLATVTGISMTDQTPPDIKLLSALIVGLANPGTVVDKLDPSKFMGVAQVARANLRGLSLSNSRGIVRDALRLPGVVNEVNSLKKIMKGTQLLDSKFTVKGFSNEVSTGSYRILHIASHGIFGGDASSSFILASDDVLSINGLQSILLSDNLKRSPIDLLTLSACETAEGNDRAPLGFSGAAIKARARSVLGTLWPVVDDAAKQVMADFYQEFVGNHSGKAVSLRKAQTALLKNPETAHPFFWAPFTLIGNWL
jgi:CHAT domain-containing protein